jgi:hypothetical protein
MKQSLKAANRQLDELKRQSENEEEASKPVKKARAAQGAPPL